MRSKGALKATRNTGKHDPDTRPTGPLAIAYAVITQGLLDAINGDPGAREWLDSRAFEGWCDWIDLSPDYVRRKVAPQLPASGAVIRRRTRYTDSDIAFVMDQRRAGLSWKEIGRSMGVSGENIWQLVKRIGHDPKTIRPKEAM